MIATNLAEVSKLMFCSCVNLSIVYMPNVERIADGYYDSNVGYGGFAATKIADMCFPKLRFVGVLAFFGC